MMDNGVDMINVLFYRLAKEAGVLPNSVGAMELLPVLVMFDLCSTGRPKLSDNLFSTVRFISVGIEWLKQNLSDEEMAELVVFRLRGELSQNKSPGDDHKIYPEGWSHLHTGGAFNNQHRFLGHNYVPLLYIKPVNTIGIISNVSA